MTEVVPITSAPSAAVVTFDNAQIQTLRETLCRDLTAPELELFLGQCKRSGLDPFSKQIYAIVTKPNDPEKRKVAFVASIDGFRLIAQRSGKYRGQVPPVWLNDEHEWVDVWLEGTKPPLACRAGVRHADFPEPEMVTITWSDYAGEYPTYTQKSMPAHMIAKATEALALRKAFPNELGGFVSSEERLVDGGSPDAECGQREAKIVRALFRRTGNDDLATRAASKVLSTPASAWPTVLEAAVDALVDQLDLDSEKRTQLLDVLSGDDATDALVDEHLPMPDPIDGEVVEEPTDPVGDDRDAEIDAAWNAADGAA